MIMPHLCNSARRITVRSTFHHKNFTCLVETRFHTMLCIYIYYITYIYNIFIGCLGLYLAFIIDTKKWQFFESLSPFPSFPIPMAYPGIALFAERHQEVEIEEVQGKRRTSVPLATCRSDIATKRQ